MQNGSNQLARMVKASLRNLETTDSYSPENEFPLFAQGRSREEN
jgi:hypothetical protein